MGTIRLGKRTEGATPKINDFVPLAGLDDIVFGGWDIFEEDCYAAARTAGVLETAQLDQVRGELEAVKPMPAVFDQRYVKRLDGPNVKKGKNKRDLAEQLIADIRAFKARHGCDRLVMLWVRQHRGLHEGRRRRTRRWRRSRRRSSTATTPSRRAWSTPTRRSAKASRSPTRRRT